MKDQRLTPSNGKVAHVSLRGKVDDVTFVEGELRSVTSPIADIRNTPNGNLERQLLFGDGFLMLEPDSGDGYCFGQAEDGDYVGYVRKSDLGAYTAPTHSVCTMGAHVYPAPQLKTVPLITLPFAAVINISGAKNGYCQLSSGGFIPLQQIAPLGENLTNFVAVAESFLFAPYLWGGDSNTGLDCSALVHIALRAQGISCPRDSDQQEATLGNALPDDAKLQRGDLIFWKGHVGIMQDETRLLHANAHFMAVVSEPLSDVCARVKAAGEAPIRTRRRLTDGAD